MKYRLELTLQHRDTWNISEREYDRDKTIISPVFDFPNKLREGEELCLRKDEEIIVENLSHMLKQGYTLIQATVTRQSGRGERFNNFVKEYQTLIDKL